MQYVPPIPDLPTQQHATGHVQLRYEDVCQDGRVLLTSMPYALGVITWRELIGSHPIATELLPKGIFAILTRLVLVGSREPVSVYQPVTGHGAFQLAHASAASGAVERLILAVWLTLTGEKGRPNQSAPPSTGAPVPVGQIFAEHVFTRLFAPPSQRKVTRFEAPSLPDVPPDRYDWRPPESAVELPADARPLEDELSPDEAIIALGLHHTDSNQHVNSLVYPRLFEEAALRRFSQLGRSTKLLSRRAEVTYRKPCFAGERVGIALRAYEAGGQLDAVGCVVSAEESASPSALALARPRCYINMLFSD